MNAHPREVAVVVPVHDEEDLLDRCLRSVARAAAPVRRAGTTVRVVTVLDDCRDASGDIATRLAAADDVVIEVDARRVGRARQAGARAALERARAHPWLVFCDADSAVPRCWLVDHLRVAGEGAHVVAGGIELIDAHLRPPAVAHAWRQRPSRGPEVYGTNLAIRADALAEAGGVPDLAVGEDQALWDVLGLTGRPRAHRPGLTVRTSARVRARAPGGFHGYLDGLQRGGPAPPARCTAS